MIFSSRLDIYRRFIQSLEILIKVRMWLINKAEAFKKSSIKNESLIDISYCLKARLKLKTDRDNIFHFVLNSDLKNKKNNKNKFERSLCDKHLIFTFEAFED